VILAAGDPPGALVSGNIGPGLPRRWGPLVEGSSVAAALRQRTQRGRSFRPHACSWRWPRSLRSVHLLAPPHRSAGACRAGESSVASQAWGVRSREAAPMELAGGPRPQNLLPRSPCLLRQQVDHAPEGSARPRRRHPALPPVLLGDHRRQAGLASGAGLRPRGGSGERFGDRALGRAQGNGGSSQPSSSWGQGDHRLGWKRSSEARAAGESSADRPLAHQFPPLAKS